MKTKRQIRKDRTKRYQAVIEAAVGTFTDYVEGETDLWFRPNNTITLQMITALSNALGTERINFSFGQSRQDGLGEYTPSYGGHPGYIQVLLPVTVLME